MDVDIRIANAGNFDYNPTQLVDKVRFVGKADICDECQFGVVRLQRFAETLYPIIRVFCPSKVRPPPLQERAGFWLFTLHPFRHEAFSLQRPNEFKLASILSAEDTDFVLQCIRKGVDVYIGVKRARLQNSLRGSILPLPRSVSESDD